MSQNNTAAFAKSFDGVIPTPLRSLMGNAESTSPKSYVTTHEDNMSSISSRTVSTRSSADGTPMPTPRHQVVSLSRMTSSVSSTATASSRSSDADITPMFDRRQGFAGGDNKAGVPQKFRDKSRGTIDIGTPTHEASLSDALFRSFTRNSSNSTQTARAAGLMGAGNASQNRGAANDALLSSEFLAASAAAMPSVVDAKFVDAKPCVNNDTHESLSSVISRSLTHFPLHHVTAQPHTGISTSATMNNLPNTHNSGHSASSDVLGSNHARTPIAQVAATAQSSQGRANTTNTTDIDDNKYNSQSRPHAFSSSSSGFATVSSPLEVRQNVAHRSSSASASPSTMLSAEPLSAGNESSSNDKSARNAARAEQAFQISGEFWICYFSAILSVSLLGGA